MSATEANNARRVARIRNFNERAFGRLTWKWAILSRRLPSQLVPHFRSIYRLLLAVDNAFSKPLLPSSQFDASDIALFNSRGVQPTNLVQDLVKHSKLKFKGISIQQFVDAAPNDLNSLAALRAWNGGPYAIRLAPHYLDHVTDELKFLHAHSRDQDIYKIQGFRSRFSKTQARTVWVIFSDSLSGTTCYCNCKCGTRTIGGCSHAVAALWLVLKERGVIVGSMRTSQHDSVVFDITAWARERRAEKKAAALPAPNDKADTVPRLEDMENAPAGQDEGESEDEDDESEAGEAED